MAEEEHDNAHTTEADPFQALAFFARQTSRFYANLEKAVLGYQETGMLPSTAVEGSGNGSNGGNGGKGRKRKVKKERAKRGPSAFNLYMRQKMAEYKEKGTGPGQTETDNTLFKMAAQAWSKLSPEDKKKYTDEFNAEKQGEAGLVALAGTEGVGADSEDSSSSEESEEEEAPPPAPAPAPEPEPEKKKKHKKNKEATPAAAAAAPKPAAATAPSLQPKRDPATAAAPPAATKTPAPAATPVTDGDQSKKKKKKRKGKEESTE